MDISSVLMYLDYVVRLLTNLLEQIAARFGIKLDITTTEDDNSTPEP